jgi:hypothetical protein
MHRNLELAHRVAAGQIAYGVAGKEEDQSSFTGGIAHLVQSVLLVGRQPVFQEIDVIGHSVPASAVYSLCQVSDLVTLTEQTGIDSIQYINTTYVDLLEHVAPVLRLIPFASLAAPCDNPERWPPHASR